MLAWLFNVTRDVLEDLGLFEQRSSYPGFLPNEEIDQWD